MNSLDNVLFDHNASKADKIIIILFSIVSAIFSSNFLFWMSWEHVIKACMSLAGLMIGGVGTKIAIKFYETYIEDKLFKKKKHGKEKDNQRAA